MSSWRVFACFKQKELYADENARKMATSGMSRCEVHECRRCDASIISGEKQVAPISNTPG